MGKCLAAITISRGSAVDLREYLHNSTAVQSALAAGLKGFEVLVNANDPRQAEIMSLWRSLENAQSFKAKDPQNPIFGQSVNSATVVAASSGAPSMFTTESRVISTLEQKAKGGRS